ncbi:MAG TPA: hypothetical protein PLS70_12155, partial [Acidobacteriota bacterium]|nr:hypothetical protein [Acidobacteriota bacterium]
MGWKTDWLYSLIFAEVRRLWNRARWESERMGPDFGPAPGPLIISEYSDGNFTNATCRGLRKRQWRYSGDEQLTLIEPDDPDISHVSETSDQMFFSVGEVRFSISADRKSLILEHLLGPRYGCGQVFQVHGQGKRGYLHLCEDEFPQIDIDQLIAKTQKRLFVNLVTHATLVTPECLQRKQYKSSFELRFFLRPPNPEHIIQAWKRGSQELEPCAPEEFLA